MPVTLTGLVEGQSYGRPELARLWGYATWNAFGKGVFTPAKQNIIVLFVTKEKQEGLVPYQDHFVGDKLFMEGEVGHGTNSRLQDAAKAGDQIVLFYRERHHTNFTYYGLVQLAGVEQERGSVVFVFETKRTAVIARSSLRTELDAHGGETTSGEEEGRRKLRTHVAYERSPNNREAAIRIHGTVCKGCGFDFDAFYGADVANSYIEIHHVKSVTDGIRVVNPSTDLVPLCANCHAIVHRRRGEILPVADLKALVDKRRLASRAQKPRLRGRS